MRLREAQATQREIESVASDLNQLVKKAVESGLNVELEVTVHVALGVGNSPMVKANVTIDPGKIDTEPTGAGL